jgi:hypothetical protein
MCRDKSSAETGRVNGMKGFREMDEQKREKTTEKQRDIWKETIARTGR